MGFNNYVFDLYGTLVDIRTDEGAAGVWEKLALFYGYYDAVYDPKELEMRYRELVKGKEADMHEAYPEIQIEQVFSQLFAEKGVQADGALLIHAGQFFRVLSTEYVRLYDGAKELLAALSAAGKKIYLLSNAQRIFTEYEMHMLGICGYFDDILISSAYGVKKPDRKFFEIIRERHQLNPRETVMVGNDGRCDIEGAKQVGFATMYIHSNISPELPEKNGKILYPDADYVVERMDMERVRDLLL